MHPPLTPPLRLSFDGDALASNWRALDLLSMSARAGAAVKADAYGVGINRVVPVLWEAGCRDFFVAHWQEAAPLLAVVPPGSVSVLHGPLTGADCAYARDNGVKPTLNSLFQVELWLASGGGPCDLMVDSGINRIGLSMAEIGDSRLAALDIDICMSHLASADEDSPQNALQLSRFRQIRNSIPARRYSLANSAGIALGADYHADLTRPGLSLYGGIARPELVDIIQQVVRPEAAIIQTRRLSAGDSVGYNARFTAGRDMRVGVISLGYADGYLRCWSEGVGMLRAGDALLPVLGRVSMDMTVIDLSNAPELREGDWISADYHLADASLKTGLSQYELLTLMGQRLARP